MGAASEVTDGADGNLRPLLNATQIPNVVYQELQQRYAELESQDSCHERKRIARHNGNPKRQDNDNGVVAVQQRRNGVKKAASQILLEIEEFLSQDQQQVHREALRIIREFPTPKERRNLSDTQKVILGWYIDGLKHFPYQQGEFLQEGKITQQEKVEFLYHYRSIFAYSKVQKRITPEEFEEVGIDITR
jgi:hypothetical protein